MKKFKMEHKLFGTVVDFDELDPPLWLTNREYAWFFEGYVLTLTVGCDVETEFNKITRMM